MHSPYLEKLSNEQREKLVQKLFEQQHGKCFICQKEINLATQKDSLDIDHIIPISVEGTRDNDTNFALAHAECNRSKGASNLYSARAIYKIQNLQSEFKRKYNENPEQYSALHTNANLGDLLEEVGGSKYTLDFTVENNMFVYSLSELGDTNVYRLPIFTDRMSGVKSVFIELPIEYCYHDDLINPRAINSSVSELIKEFNSKRPQLQVSLARINDDKKVYIFDGQHKSAAQIALGADKLFMRLFIDYDIKELLVTNQRAGKELKQIEFDKNILIQLNSRIYQDMVEKYQKAHNLKEDEFKFSETDLLQFFANDSKLKSCIIDNQKNLVAKNSDNKLLQFIDFDGRGKNLPISYDAYNSTFLYMFIDSKRFVSEPLENENNQRMIELRQLTRLQNIIAENMYIGKFDSTMETAQIESKVANGKGNNISDDHLACFRYSKKEIMYCWLSKINEMIHYYLTVNMKFKDEMIRNYFKTEIDEPLWSHIENYIKMILGLPLWKDRSLSETIFATKQTLDFWKSVFETGKSPDGIQVLASPVSISTIFANSKPYHQ